MSQGPCWHTTHYNTIRFEVIKELYNKTEVCINLLKVYTC